MAALLSEVHVGPRDLGRFEPIVGAEAVGEVIDAAEQIHQRLAGRVVWNINSTAVGGGVAEMLQPLLGYSRGAGVDTRWLVIGGEPGFFELTKRIHHALHGEPGDGRPLDDSARQLYEANLAANAAELTVLVRPGDFVLLHDPQTAGLAPHLLDHGAEVIWRCHIGHDHPGDEVTAGWAFLRRYLEQVKSLVFSRAAYAPSWAAAGRVAVIQPSIDAFAAKNEELSKTQVRSILTAADLIAGPRPPERELSFVRADGSPSRVGRRADVVRDDGPPPADAPLVVQVSRWDPLKDMAGVMEGFARIDPGEAHLVLAGPDVKAVADDPEAPAVFDDVLRRRQALEPAVRERVHLVNLPTADIEENAVIVNALQRHAAVVVQKSLHEGFGLTVTEAMWKGRPVIASAVGGIADQIEPGISGLLLDDPRDLAAFARVLEGLLADPERARELGEGARERVRERFLGIRHLLQYAELLERLDDGG